MSELVLRKMEILEESDHLDIYWVFMLGDTVFKLEGAPRRFNSESDAIDAARSKNLLVNAHGSLYPMPKAINLDPEGTLQEEIRAAQEAGYELIDGSMARIQREQLWDVENLLERLYKTEKALAPKHISINRELGKHWAYAFVGDHVGLAHALADSPYHHGVFRRINLSEDEMEKLVLHIF